MGGKRSGEQVYFTWYLVFNVHLSSYVEYFERGPINDSRSPFELKEDKNKHEIPVPSSVSQSDPKTES